MEASKRLDLEAKAQGKKIVVIVGAGFGGLNAAKTLAGKAAVHVILIDQKNHHLFQPLLYQVATAGLNTGDIAVPIRAQFSKYSNVEVHLGKIGKINLDKKTVESSEDHPQLAFDYLILACGAKHSYFNHPEWEDLAPGLKTLEQAVEIRRRILLAFEKAESCLDSKKQQALLSFIVIGGGPTGVELAGAIADISRTVLVHDFKRIDASQSKVTLIEGGPRLLAAFSEKCSAQTEKDLEFLGVTVRTSSKVDNITRDGVYVGEELVPSCNVFWAAGVQAAAMDMAPPVEKDSSGRIKVLADLSIPKFPDTFVIGDMAAIESKPGKWVPGLAPAALQAGKYAGQRILSKIQGQQMKPFRYRDKGQMATIGKFKAVVQVKNITIFGYLAWLAWLFLHIFYLVSFKNRVSVMLQWAWNYLFSKRGSRLISEQEWKQEQ